MNPRAINSSTWNGLTCMYNNDTYHVIGLLSLSDFGLDGSMIPDTLGQDN